MANSGRLEESRSAARGISPCGQYAVICYALECCAVLLPIPGETLDNVADVIGAQGTASVDRYTLRLQRA